MVTGAGGESRSYRQSAGEMDSRAGTQAGARNVVEVTGAWRV